MKQKFLSWLSSWLSEKHLSWINEYFISIVIIVLVIIGSILAFIYDSRKRKKRAESLKEFLPQHLMHSSPNENLISKFNKPTGVMQFSDNVSACFFGGGVTSLTDFFIATNLIEGNMGSIDFVTYDYHYYVSGGAFGSSEIFTRGTAILLQSDQVVLPYLKWGRKGVQPESTPKTKEEAGFKQCPTCGSLDVFGGAMTEGGGFGDFCPHCKKSLYKMHKEKAHNLFELVSIADLRGWSGLASNTQLLLYRKSPVPAKKYQKFIEKALNIFQVFQSVSQNLKEHA